MARIPNVPSGDDARNPNRPGSFGAPARREDGLWWVKTDLDSRRHHLDRYRAWAVDAAIFDRMEFGLYRGVELRTAEGAVLRAKADVWKKHGFEIDLGHGEQFALRDKWWTPDGESEAPATASAPCAPLPSAPGSNQYQLALELAS